MPALFVAPLLVSPWIQQDPARLTPVAAAEPKWEFSVSAFYVDPPNGDPHGTTILYADRGQLHLEGRYNYEDLETFSLFGGWTFEFGTETHAALTPMLGVIAGDTTGFAPGLLIDAGWKKLEFYSESEYVFDTTDDDEDYFYSWSTLMWRFSQPVAVGIVTERSKIVDTDLSLNRGFVASFTPGPVGFAIYAYNPGSEDEYYTLSVGFGF